MAYYLFIRTKDPPSSWELLEAVKNKRVAERAMKDYKRMVGSQKVKERDVVMVEANSAEEARKKLEYHNN
jgi:hypothetical protein